MDYILGLFYLTTFWIIMQLFVFWLYRFLSSDSRKTFNAYSVPRKYSKQMPRWAGVKTCEIRCSQKSSGFNCYYKLISEGFLITEMCPLFPLRSLAKTIFIPWLSLSSPEPLDDRMFGLVKNYVSFSVDDSSMSIVVKREDLKLPFPQTREN